MSEPKGDSQQVGGPRGIDPVIEYLTPPFFLEQTLCFSSVNDRENSDVPNSGGYIWDETHCRMDTGSFEVIKFRQFEAALLYRLGLP